MGDYTDSWVDVRKVIVGPPGTGKTGRISREVERIQRDAGAIPLDSSPVIVVSLTRAAALEARGRTSLPRDAVGTSHALGWRSQGPDRPSLPTATQLAAWQSDTGYRMAAANVDDLGGDDCAESAAYHMHRHRLDDRDRWPSDVAVFARRWEEFKASNHVCDFTDMIEFADRDVPMGAAHVVVDEAQDCSPLEHRMLAAWGQSAGSLTLVGDPLQSLFDWRGAFPEALVDQPHTELLSQSYRLPQTVHAAAVAWARDLDPPDYMPTSDRGEATMCRGGSGSPDAVIAEAVAMAAAGERVIIAATCTYMLRDVISEMKLLGVPFGNRWRPDRRAWNPLGSSDGKKTTTSWSRLISLIDMPSQGGLWSRDDLRRWVKVIRADGVLRRGAKADILSKEKFERFEKVAPLTFDELLRWFEPEVLGVIIAMDTTSLVSWWRGRLAGRDTATGCSYACQSYVKYGMHGLRDDEGDPLINVGTIHSFKGAEADNVFLFPDLSRAARMSYDQSPVIRTIYVGMTRAKRRLRLCLPSSSSAVRWPDVVEKNMYV